MLLRVVSQVNELKEMLEERLSGIQNEIDSFKEKEISRDMEEVYADKRLLEDINKRILECQKEAQNVNNEEELLGLSIVVCFVYLLTTQVLHSGISVTTRPGAPKVLPHMLLIPAFLASRRIELFGHFLLIKWLKNCACL